MHRLILNQKNQQSTLYKVVLENSLRLQKELDLTNIELLDFDTLTLDGVFKIVLEHRVLNGVWEYVLEILPVAFKRLGYSNLENPFWYNPEIHDGGTGALNIPPDYVFQQVIKFLKDNA